MPAQQGRQQQHQQQNGDEQHLFIGDSSAGTTHQPQQQAGRALERSALLQNLTCKPAILAAYAVVVLGIVYYTSNRGHTPGNAVTAAAAQTAGSSSSNQQFSAQLAPGQVQSSMYVFRSISSDSDRTNSSSIGSSSIIPSNSSPDDSSSSSATDCPYGSLPGTWVSTAEPGARWQTLLPACQLHNWLAAYATPGKGGLQSGSDSSAAATGSAGAAAGSGGAADIDADAAGAENDSQGRNSSSSKADKAAAAAGSSDAAGSSSSGPNAADNGQGVDANGVPSAAEHAEQGGAFAATDTAAAVRAGSSGSSSSGQPPEVRILLLSDSVDRFIVQHLCDHIGGVKHTHSMRPSAVTPTEQQHQQQGDQSEGSSATQDSSTAPPAAAAPVQTPSSLNKTAYAFHTCSSKAPVKFASSYFPGVHPSGPYHREVAQDFRQRIDHARLMWFEYAGPDQHPHMVSVASLLWDVARLYMHERDRLNGRQELERQVLDSWMANFTVVVGYAQLAFPETKLWATHTTMLPRYAASTGLMVKPYLGRRYFIKQLNAAAAAAALKLELQLLDYAAVAERFMEGQTYLADLIHPNLVVGVEVFNMMLNLVIQHQTEQQQQQKRFQHVGP